MKTDKYILVLIIAFLQFRAQINLVNNYSFENYSACPTAYDQMSLSIGWQSAGGSPDYYNFCGTASCSVPGNYAGHQSASNGYAYAGVFIAMPNNNGIPAREYLYTTLQNPLTPGVKYFLSMKASIAELWTTYDDSFWSKTQSVNTITYCPTYMPCNRLGMKFTMSSNFRPNNPVAYVTSLMNNSAHLYSQSIISDTTNWTTISGSFVADSAYSHLVIGNFFDNAHTDTLGRPYVTQSYYYIDDVIVSSDSLALSARELEQLSSARLEISPNPTHHTFRIKAFIQKSEMGTFLLSDIFGNIKYRRSEYLIAGDNYFEETLYLPAGIYFLVLETTDHARSARKVVIE